MKCPYRTVTIHNPQYTENYVTHYAKDVVEFAECHKFDCLYYKGINECEKIERERRFNEQTSSDR